MKIDKNREMPEKEKERERKLKKIYTNLIGDGIARLNMEIAIRKYINTNLENEREKTKFIVMRMSVMVLKCFGIKSKCSKVERCVLGRMDQSSAVTGEYSSGLKNSA